MASSSPDRLTQSEVDAQLRQMSEGDWARASRFASFRVQGMAGMTADDLLSEAIVKLLTDERVWRPGLPPLVALWWAMRGIASNVRKRDSAGPINEARVVSTTDDPDKDEQGAVAVLAQHQITPERVFDGRQQVEALMKLVEDDEDLGLVLMAWGDELRGEEAAAELGWDFKRYEAVRKRLNRRLAPLKLARSAQ